MWQVVAFAAIILISKSAEATNDFQVHKNEKESVLQRLEDMDTGPPSKLLDPTSKTVKSLKSHVERRSIVNLDIHDGSTMHRLDSGSPLISKWSYWPDIEHEKIIRSIEQRRNHALVIQERRNPSFSPWGGKRDASVYKPDPKIRRPARVPFNSWGGKRNGGATVIKKPFNSWGGKRSKLIEHIFTTATRMNEPLRKAWRHFIINNPKLVGIDSRNLAMSNLKAIEKRQEYVNLEGPTASFNNHLPRAPFDPWGGKKRESDEDTDETDVSSASSSPSDSNSE